MHIAELIEIAIAHSGARRVEVAALEPADVAMEAVSGLAQLVSELVDNAIAFSEPGDTVRVTGLFDQADYLISISDRGLGIPGQLMSELNRILEAPGSPAGPEPKMGIALVARLAARLGIAVRLAPGVPGTTARVTVPSRLVSAAEARPDDDGTQDGHRLPLRQRHTESLLPEVEQVFAPSGEMGSAVDLSRFESRPRPDSGVIAMTEEARQEAEAFLERVFAPIVGRPGVVERPAGRSPVQSRPPDLAAEPRRAERQPGGGTVTALRVRVPGENFVVVEDDPSTVAGEGAIDIKSALSRYEQGRRSARRSQDEDT